MVVSNDNKAPWLRTDDRDEQIRLLRARLGEVQRETEEVMRRNGQLLQKLREAEAQLSRLGYDSTRQKRVGVGAAEVSHD